MGLIDKIDDLFIVQYCSLDAMVKFKMGGVNLYQDKKSLNTNSEINYLSVFYQGVYVATAYQDKFHRHDITKISSEEHPQINKLFNLLEGYYSVF